MSTVSDLESARTAIEFALHPHAPLGDPAAIADRADEYGRAAQDADVVANDLRQVARGSLPSAWRGTAAETAAQAVDALAAEAQQTAAALRQASSALSKWSGDLSSAQAQDRQGAETLVGAAKQLGFLGLEVWHQKAAADQALQGADARIAAARLAEDSGTRTASTLRQLTSKARAEHVTASGVDPLSAIVLANEDNPGGKVDGGLILSGNALDRGSQQLDRMSPADRAAFEKMLQDAKSPQEAAYLWKALGAGHSLADIQKFGAAIHPHGDDPTWLAGHLTPDMTNGNPDDRSDARTNLTYQGKPYSELDTQGADIYDQGNVNDCVAASTVIAQANVDPTVMLNLTTGGTANGDDSPATFHQRLQDMYTSQYIQGQQADGVKNVFPATDAGLGSKGEDLLANQDLAGTTGSGYHYVQFDGNDDRRGALTSIENAVDAGKPVPIDVQGGGEGHQMMIIGRDGDRLEIYNPWGYTTWVSEDQFVNNQLGGVTGTPMNSASAVELPK